MLWLFCAIATFFVTARADIMCYSNEDSDDATVVNCTTYCDITYGPEDENVFAISQSCSEEPAMCDIFGAVNNCISASITFQNVSYTCNGNTAVVNSNSITNTFKAECCNSNLCNDEFSSSCSSSSALQTYLTDSITCIYNSLDDLYSEYGSTFCGDVTTFYTQSSCALVEYEVKTQQCLCNSYMYLYGQASTDAEKDAIEAYYNLTSGPQYDSKYGCYIMTDCSTTSFTYSITSYSFTMSLSVQSLTSYNLTVVIAYVYLSLSPEYIDDFSQLYVSSTSISSNSGVASIINVVAQYSTYQEANISRTAVATGQVTILVGPGLTATVSSVSEVQTNTYSISGVNSYNVIGALVISIISWMFYY